ncbi:MAG: inositol monophosphatase family protein [Cyanobacteriota bacterium]|nr:inositol monophosphatase family protein [Cyanobacteriota bacterium]
MKSLNENQSEALVEIGAIARKIGWGATDILRSYYRGEMSEDSLEIKDKKDGPVTSADLAANRYILENLKSALGEEEFGYESEETVQDGAIEKDWVWVIDPLDGTRDFIDKTGEYALHIALAYKGRPMLAVVTIPEAEKLYFAIKGQGTYLETRDGTSKRISVSDRSRIEDLSMIASRSHRDKRLNTMLERMPFKERHYMGSVGGKISTIVDGSCDVYISLSGKSAPKDWDFAAPELILTEAGGKFTSFEGEELIYNSGDPSQWGGLMASNGRCHRELYTLATELLTAIDAEGTAG